MFQSPRSGKFVSNTMMATVAKSGKDGCFNPLDRGNLYQIGGCSLLLRYSGSSCFNPLDRGNLYQMNHLASAEARGLNLELIGRFCFNPLDRGNLYQIKPKFHHKIFLIVKFQSPRLGKFVSDVEVEKYELVSVSFNPLDRGNLYLIRCSFCCWRN